MKFQEEGKSDCMASCMQMNYVESEEDLRAMVGDFVEVCRKGLKVNAGKNKGVVLNGEERLKVMLVWMACDKIMCLNSNTWSVFWMNLIQMRQSLIGRRVERGLLALLGLWLILRVCSFNVLGTTMRHCSCLFLYSVLRMMWKEKCRIRTGQIGNLRGLLRIRRMDKNKM